MTPQKTLDYLGLYLKTVVDMYVMYVGCTREWVTSSRPTSKSNVLVRGFRILNRKKGNSVDVVFWEEVIIVDVSSISSSSLYLLPVISYIQSLF